MDVRPEVLTAESTSLSTPRVVRPFQELITSAAHASSTCLGDTLALELLESQVELGPWDCEEEALPSLESRPHRASTSSPATRVASSTSDTIEQSARATSSTLLVGSADEGLAEVEPSRASTSPKPEQDEGDWSGRVAAERPEGPLLDRLPPSEVQPRGTAQLRSTLPDTSALPAARLQLSVAMQALEVCEAQLRHAAETDSKLRRVAQQDFAAEAAEARAEVEQLRRELQRLRGLPRELSLLSNNELHVLQQELSEALHNVHYELESRTKCCVCRVQEREVVLHPCMHLVLCRSCTMRVTSCPLCRSPIETHASVRVA